jgi:hypothetical protein
MSEKSNIELKSNIMLEGRKTLMQSCPGDFAGILFADKMREKRGRAQHFSSQQIHEYQQTLRCGLCGRSCAGSCEFNQVSANQS